MNEDLLDQLVEVVRAHYREPEAQPLLLSRIGQKHRDLLLALKEAFGTLSKAVQAAGPQRLRIVDDRVGRETVAPADLADRVEVRIQETTARQTEGSSNFDSLPRSVQIAFCLRTDAGELVTLRVTPPFEYKKISSLEFARPGFRYLPDDFRKPGLVLNDASPQDREVLWQAFLAWTTKENLDAAAFRQTENRTALARLLAAQPPDILPRLVIPADIAAMLLRRS